MELIFGDISIAAIVSTIFFAFLGVGLLAACYWVFDRITPFCITTEIQKEKNMAMSILLGSVFISIAIIVAAVIRS